MNYSRENSARCGWLTKSENSANGPEVTEDFGFSEGPVGGSKGRSSLLTLKEIASASSDSVGHSRLAITDSYYMPCGAKSAIN